MTPERLWRSPAHVAIEWIYPILVDSVALPLANDPNDLSGKGRMGLLQFVDYHLEQQIFPTKDTWGENPRSVAAVAAMESAMPLDPDALAYMEAQRAARAAEATPEP